MKRAALLCLLSVLLLCSCAAGLEKYPTERTDLFSSFSEREQVLDEGTTAGIAYTVSKPVRGLEIRLPAQDAVSFLLYIYNAEKPYADTVGKVSPVFKKEIDLTAGEKTVTVYFNGPEAGKYYFVLEAKTSLCAVFCLPCDGAVGYFDGQVSATVPKISVLCE